MAKSKGFSINCKGNLLDISSPWVMGILNSTPDSFFNQGREQQVNDLLALAETMLAEGANVLDLGGMSTRPGATEISLDEERERVIPALKAIRHTFPEAIISIDTYRSALADEALHLGATMINDVSGGNLDEHMVQVVAKHKAPYICMHMQGTPATMQQQPHYENVVQEVFAFFQRKIKWLHKHGVHDVILDPGFGFGKTMHHNYELMANLDIFSNLNHPVLVGISRKKMVQQPLGITVENALNGSTVLHTIALMKNASILRVHDVKQAKEAVTLWNTLEDAAS
ncbi:MAG: dihydropteroate synthase [Chitinophagaceae bacterium]|nr:dihydropteroate synthase [Chitinophagaceae bacterium]